MPALAADCKEDQLMGAVEEMYHWSVRAYPSGVI